MSTTNRSLQVQHSFDGDVKILNATLDRRLELRKALTNLAQDLQRIDGRPTEVKTEVNIRFGGPESRQYVYTVTITDNAFDAEEFDRLLPLGQSERTSNSSNEYTNGRRESVPQSTSGLVSQGENEFQHARPFKRPRTSRESAGTPTRQPENADLLSTELLPASRPSTAAAGEDLFAFMKKWHEEWVQQGGWLFDNITNANASTSAHQQAIETKLGGVQDVLGQSLNSASASTMAELSNINRLIPWLERCRKVHADKVQAREEKWRSSSATFHDQARREREAAERKIEKKLEEQRMLLTKLARANGIHVDELDVAEQESQQVSRETSLGAQLTRELNMEASRAATDSRFDAEHEAIDVDIDVDDDE